MNFNYNYFGQSYTNITINTNGYIQFGFTNSCPINKPNNLNLIPALNFDLDASRNGGIYYQNIPVASNDITSITNDIRLLSPSFNPTNAFRVTWQSVPPYGASSPTASFQIVLTSSFGSFYVLLKYTECLNGATLRSTPGLNYLLNNQAFEINIANPCTSSNVNQAGTWVFDVSSGNFY